MQIVERLHRFGFPCTEEQGLVASSSREFAARRLAPGAQERDRTGRFPLEHVPELAALGLLAMKVPAADGGAGADNVSYVLAMEAIAEVCASTAVIVAASNLASKLISDHGTAEQKARWLAPYVRGELGPASFALTEPSGGSDAAALRTSARADGDSWVLDGEKAWITSGAHAGLHLVFARTDGHGKEGLSCFVVERGTPGLVIGKEEDKLGQRSSGTVALSFESCRVPAANLLGRRGAGYGMALSAVGPGRSGIAALSLGIAEAALAAGASHAKERRAFGQALVDFQNTQFVLADSRTELDAAWLLTLRAARRLDAGERAVAETSMAKLFASETCGRIVDRMLQLHGGYGYSREFLVERLYRDARVTRIYEGTSEIQRLVIWREMARDGA
ncbi:MAG: acyl-CoA dehydrogenase family protein [Labilithrix sp.]|nr:acyl-CoA dehydrogenase family protein [Labilithrix sp.]MCW5834447.1 acyl-CoA dehydrogenase family protein [Labilithrix sp.]